MAQFCLPRVAVAAFKKEIGEGGRINVTSLTRMSSQQRRALLSEVLGDREAAGVNALFESKLFLDRRRILSQFAKNKEKGLEGFTIAQKKRLLKAQKAGYEKWVENVKGTAPDVKRGFLDKIKGFESVLDEVEQDKFLDDFVSKRLGVDVDVKEAQTLMKMSKEARAQKVTRDSAVEAFKAGKISSEELDKLRLPYGRAQYDLNAAFNDMKSLNEIAITNVLSKESPVKLGSFAMRYVKNPLHVVPDIGGFAKSLKAALDNSFLFRQGLKTLFENPKLWARNSLLSFRDLGRVIAKGGKEADAIKREFMAHVLSDPDYETLIKMKIDIDNIEEAFPSSLPEHIPGVGRLFKASELAYSMNAYRSRFGLAKQHLDIMRAADIPLNKFELEGTGRYINSLTGRGHLGRLEPIGEVMNQVFFSARMVKSHFDSLTAHVFDPNVPVRLKKRSALNTLKLISGMAAVLGTAKAINPDSVDFDPRSANAGKIRIGDTRFDVSGGMSSMAILASRLAAAMAGQPAIKSSSTGKLRKINDGSFLGTTSEDLIYDFFSNKLSPSASLIKSILNQTNRDGERLTAARAASDLLAPLPITNAIQSAQEKDSANLLLIMLADGLGIGTNTYE